MSKKNKVLLVVEDDPGLQKQLKWSFEGYEVVIAGDREEAICRSLQPHVCGPAYGVHRSRDRGERE